MSAQELLGGAQPQRESGPDPVSSALPPRSEPDKQTRLDRPTATAEQAS